MGLAMCPVCCEDEDIEVVRVLDSGRQLVRHRCGQEWEHGEVLAQGKRPSHLFNDLKARFPKPEDVEPGRMERANRLKARYLATRPGTDPEVMAYWAKYQEVFSADGLWTCDPQLLKDFANSDVGAHPGNQSMFNSTWNTMGEAAAADSTRRTIEYLLYGPAAVPLEDRLEHLLTGAKPFAMTGFKEALLTKVLCVVQPDRFLPILKYTTDAGGKREIARKVYGLELPAPESVNWTLGRLILWSNDVLRALVGDGFADQERAAAFLWWAKDRTAEF
jgi:hypothetical protein